MRVTPRQYAEGLYEAARHVGDSDRRTKLIDRFLLMLARDRRRSDIPLVLSHLDRIAERETGVKFVEAVSAKPLHVASKTSLERAGKKLFGGKEVRLRQKVSATLLGGALLQTEDESVDMSIGGRFGQLARFIQSNL